MMGCIASGASQGIITDGLKLWLDAGNPSSFSGVPSTAWNDLSGNGNNGTLVNGVAYSTANGGVISFDGSNDYVNINSIIVPDISAFSFSVWVKLVSTTSPQYQRVIDISDATKNFQLAIIGSNFVTAHSQINTDGNGEKHVYSIPNNLWINVTCTYSSNTMKVYNNGVLLTKVAETGTINRTAIRSLTHIGRRNDGNFQTSFNGSQNENLIYNRALTAAEVLTNFNGTKAKYGL